MCTVEMQVYVSTAGLYGGNAEIRGWVLGCTTLPGRVRAPAPVLGAGMRGAGWAARGKGRRTRPRSEPAGGRAVAAVAARRVGQPPEQEALAAHHARAISAHRGSRQLEICQIA